MFALLGCTMFCGMSCRNRSCKIYPERAFPQFKGGKPRRFGKITHLAASAQEFVRLSVIVSRPVPDAELTVPLILAESSGL